MASSTSRICKLNFDGAKGANGMGIAFVLRDYTW